MHTCSVNRNSCFWLWFQQTVTILSVVFLETSARPRRQIWLLQIFAHICPYSYGETELFVANGKSPNSMAPPLGHGMSSQAWGGCFHSMAGVSTVLQATNCKRTGCYQYYNYIILYCIMLYCIMLYCIILYCIILYYIILYFVILYYIILYFVILYYIILFYVIFFLIISY